MLYMEVSARGKATISPPFNVFPLGTAPPALFGCCCPLCQSVSAAFQHAWCKDATVVSRFKTRCFFVTCMPSLSLLLGHSPFTLVSEYGRSQCNTFCFPASPHFPLVPLSSFIIVLHVSIWDRCVLVMALVMSILAYSY